MSGDGMRARFWITPEGEDALAAARPTPGVASLGVTERTRCEATNRGSGPCGQKALWARADGSRVCGWHLDDRAAAT